jgi:hypothetical protein
MFTELSGSAGCGLKPVRFFGTGYSGPPRGCQSKRGVSRKKLDIRLDSYVRSSGLGKLPLQLENQMPEPVNLLYPAIFGKGTGKTTKVNQSSARV